MNGLDEIYQTWLITHDWLLEEEMHERLPEVGRWERKTELNDYAYFVLLFGQLEDHVNEEYALAIGPAEGEAFMHRVNCLFDEGSLTAERINDYYLLRCEIAHGNIMGGQLTGEIHLPGIFADIRQIVGS